MKFRPIHLKRFATTSSGAGSGIADFVVGFVFLVVILVTRWSDWLRDLAYRWGFQSYTLSLFIYLLLFSVISKVLGLGVHYYGFRLEPSFKLSTQRLGSWVMGRIKGFLVGLVLAAIVVELLYFTSGNGRSGGGFSAWALFMGLFILLAQLAPVVLFPIFYKFEPLDNEDLRRRLVVLSERAGTRVRGVYRWKLSEKSKKANAALTGLGEHSPHHPGRYPARQLHAGRNRSSTGSRTRPPCASPYSQEHLRSGGDHASRFLGGELDPALRGRPAHVRGDV